VCLLTIVGGGREAWSVWGRGTREKVWARGPYPAWSAGPSTSPLDLNEGAVPYKAKVVLHCKSGVPKGLDELVETFWPVPISPDTDLRFSS
jgi:hypothetical protein